jgi:hypothetical protein
MANQVDQTSVWLSVEELAARWGDMPLGTVRKHVSNGKGPRRVRFGKRIRFHIDDVIAWEKARREASA